MSFDTYRTYDEDMRKLESDIRYRFGIQRVHARKTKGLCLLSTYASWDLVTQHFVADTESSEQFVFVKRPNSDAEQVFTIRGALSAVALPPVRKPIAGRSLNARGMYQFIKLTSYRNDPVYLESAHGVDNILDLLSDAVPEHVSRREIITSSGRTPFLTFKTPLVTTPGRVHPSDIITVPDLIDPKGILADGILQGDFVMSKDNRVTFNRFAINGDGEWVRTENVTPALFRPGAIVEAGVTIRLLRLRDRPYKILFHLDSISLLNDEGPKIMREIRSKSKFHTPLPFPPKETNYDADTEDSEGDVVTSDIDNPMDVDGTDVDGTDVDGTDVDGTDVDSTGRWGDDYLVGPSRLDDFLGDSSMLDDD